MATTKHFVEKCYILEPLNHLMMSTIPDSKREVRCTKALSYTQGLKRGSHHFGVFYAALTIVTHETAFGHEITTLPLRQGSPLIQPRHHL
jgi:hypothetical protein